MSQWSFHVNLSSIGAFWANLTFDPLYDLCLLTYDLHFIFNMFRVSQWSFHVNLSSIGAFFEKIWPLTPYMTFAFWPMTFISFLICLECHKWSFHVNLSSIGAFLKNLTFDLTFLTPTWPLAKIWATSLMKHGPVVLWPSLVETDQSV